MNNLFKYYLGYYLGKLTGILIILSVVGLIAVGIAWIGGMLSG